jgi:hypothetical protein
MNRFVSRPAAYGALTAVLVLMTFEGVSWAKTSPLRTAASLVALPDPAMGQPWRGDAPRLGRFVTCHISRHPIGGFRSVERVCPLFVADALRPRTADRRARMGADAHPGSVFEVMTVATGKSGAQSRSRPTPDATQLM